MIEVFLNKFLEFIQLPFVIIFLSFVLIHLFYNLYFFLRLAIYNKFIDEGLKLDNKVSVIICAKNEVNKLSQNLPIILNQEISPTFEVLVVNDNSEDHTPFVLDDFKKKYPQLNFINLNYEGKLIAGKKYPLSIGIRSAKNESLLLTDADCFPHSEKWAKCFQYKFSLGYDLILGYSPYLKSPGLLNSFIRYETYHTALQYLSFSLAGMPYMGVGRNLAYNKNLFLKSKGFVSINNILSGDDDLFVNKVATSKNTTICIEPDSFTYSLAKKTWKSWYNQKSRHLSTATYYRFKHKFFLFLYQLATFFLIPSCGLALYFYLDFYYFTLSILGILFLFRNIVQYFTLKKLHCSDLFWILIFQDFLLPIYYIIFLPSLFKKPSKTW